MKTPITMLLGRKGPVVLSVSPSQSVADAVRTMNHHKIGCVIVTEGRQLVGIFTERDVLTRVVVAGCDPATTRVQQVMTNAPQTIRSNATIEDAMDIITSRRCRHLPVMEGDSVVGLISIGDVTHWLLEQHRSEADHLRKYIAGGLVA